MVEMEILPIRGVLVVVEEPQAQVVIGAQVVQEMVEVQHQQKLLMPQLEEPVVAVVVEVVMDIHPVVVVELVVELVVQDQIQQAQLQEPQILAGAGVVANNVVFKEVVLMEDLA